MIDSKKLLSDLESKKTSRTTMVKRLEDDLRKRCDKEPGVDAPLKAQYETAKAKKRTALTYKAWRDEELTQIAVAWVLACVFVRFLEDNGLVEVPKLSGPGERLRRARDEHELFIQRQPLGTERDFLLEVFEETGRLPGMKEFFDKKHNPLWLAAPSGDACRELWLFWQKTDPVTGDLLHDFTDPDWNTRFLGDLYQDLSEAARKRYALLQTPDFVEEFILDRTLTPALSTFGYREVRMIDPTCGSGHFVLGGFRRIFKIWQQENPGENPRVLAQRALDAVCGVDLNPFAVAIARFRLLLAALQVCGVKRLADAPDFHISLAVGDSLIHGARFDSSGQPYRLERQTLFGGEEEVFKDEVAHFFATEDSVELHRILGRQYHAVVGNPPYITVKDRALSEFYRARYSSCHGKYSLSVPFMERFFDLAVAGDGPGQPAGFVGQITANSFMKAEFGKKLIEEYVPRWDLTHVLDTSGASIPGHDTPTVILFGKNQPPVNGIIRTVLGIRGEPATPADPAQGLVWQAIVRQVDDPGSESEWMSAADALRAKFHAHPWSIGGGGASELKEMIDDAAETVLGKIVGQLRSKPNIGITAFTLEDDIFVQPENVLRRHRLPRETRRVMVEGDTIRDWHVGDNDSVVWPYSEAIELIPQDPNHPALRLLWTARTCLANNVMFGDQTKVEAGLAWYEFGRLTAHKLRVPLSITYAFVSTHNHFVLDRGGKVFKQTAPVIKLKAEADECEHVRLLGVLNSSTACFWGRQTFFPRGGFPDGRWQERLNWNCTPLGMLPIPARQPTQIPTALVKYSDALKSHLPGSILAGWYGDGISSAITSARDLASNQRRKLIAWQEELDWQIYEAFGLIESRDEVSLPEGQAMDAIPPDGIALGERAFEIVLARRMAAGEVQTTWFARHGSTPITEVPASWPAAYRELVERRIARIASDPNLRLIEQPEYKRRWNTEPWDAQFTKAARDWLLARLEGYFFEGERVCELKDFDPSAHGFIAATRPHLVSASQLADVVPLDPSFMEVAEAYVGASGFSVAKLIRELVESESVPYLPHQRYKESGLRKRHDWEQVWDLQRREDAIDAESKIDEPGITDVERLQRQAAAKKGKEEKLGDLPVPPKYAGADFKKPSYWKLRGKLDVPKERWISYPGAERAGDDSLVIAWAGWDHLQQAQALAEYYLDAKDNQGWSPERLKPLLAGISDLIPWLKQWHNTPDPNLGMGLGDYFAGFLEEQCRGFGWTVEEVDKARFETALETAPTARKVAGNKKAGRKGKAASTGLDALESDGTGHWQDQEFRLLAPKRRALTDYRMLVWPELLRQMPGAMEFETFRKAYWLLSEPEEFEALGRDVFPDIPASWWRSRTERLAKDEFLNTLKGSVALGDVKIWKQDGERFVRWLGGSESSDFPEAVDDARIALQLASFWTENETDAVRATLEPELVLLETR